MSYYKPTKQTTFGTEGNCLSAVIATLFDVKISDIPNFADTEETWEVELSKWMAIKFGKYIAPIKLTATEDSSYFCDSLIITTINSLDPSVERHAVITKRDKIIFDPMIGEVNRPLSNDMNPIFMVVGDVLTATSGSLIKGG